MGVFLKSADLYALPSERVSWFVLAKRAQKLNQILLGYQLKSNHEEIEINPKDKDVPKYWTDCDFVVVARDDKVSEWRGAKRTESAQERKRLIYQSWPPMFSFAFH